MPRLGAGAKALERELRRRFVVETQPVSLGNETIELLRPRSPEDLISEEDFARDERLPYWAELWPSAIVLAREIGSRQEPARRMLELGCGLGLVTIAALRAGHHVVASDYYEDALRFTRLNAARATGTEPDCLLLDWRRLPDDLPTFERIVAADVLYERPYGTIVANVLRRALSPGGVAVIADPGRVAADALLDEARALGLEIVQRDERRWSAGKIRQTITLHVLRRP
jgi:predicted nicotinamide N-methyase